MGGLEDQFTIFLPVGGQHLGKLGGQNTVAFNSKTDVKLCQVDGQDNKRLCMVIRLPA